MLKKVQQEQARNRKRTAAQIIAEAVTKAHNDGKIGELAEAYRNRGGVPTLFGVHRPARPERAGPVARLNYNPTAAELAGYERLAAQHKVSRSVHNSLCLAYYFGFENPADIV